MGQIVKVAGVQIIRLSLRLLYSAPFDDSEAVMCEHCEKRCPKSPCPYCGYPSARRYVKPGGVQT
jgi:hypothetical protein